MARTKIYTPNQNPSTTAFGELSTAQPTPRVLLHFPYNLNTDVISTTTTGSGSVTHSGQFAVIGSGAATSSSGTLESLRLLEYNPGTGGLARFTSVFDTPVAGNTQISGIGNATDGFFFGYNGTSFGILYRSNSSDTWIPQETWNGNRMLGNESFVQTLDTSKGNVFQIRYQWLGFGAITFSIENSVSGAIEIVHTIRYANLNTTVSVNNPSFPFLCKSTNTTNNTNIEIKVPSVGLYIEGQDSSAGETRNCVSNTKTGVTTELNVLTIRNKTTYQSLNNTVVIQPDFLTMSVDGTKNVILKVYLNATLGGTPSYNDVRVNNSVIDFDVAGTTVSSGILLAAFALDKAGSLSQPLREFQFFLYPGNTMTITAISSSSTDATVAISWAERFK